LAFDLKAVLRLDDKFSDKMRRAQRTTERMKQALQQTQRATEAFNSAANQTQTNLNRFASAGKQTIQTMRSMVSSLNPLRSGFLGLASAIGGAVAAKKIFDSTVWEAAKFENSQVVIRAMFDDRKAADSYMKMLERFAVDSPVLNSQDMFENSKSFIATSKNIKQLEKMWNLAERLVALDPAQGVSGAVLALKEFFSGDVVSLVERFELPRAELKAIKDLPLDQKLKELDTFFNKLGATNKLVKEMGGTTIGLWNRVREQFAILLREMGKPSLEVLSGFFTQIIQRMESGELNRFAEIGGKMIKSILTGLTNGITAIYEWFTSITNSEEFKNRTTLYGKVSFIIEDIYNRFMNWLNSEGMAKIQAITETLVGTLAKAIENNSGQIAAAALSVGLKIGSSIAKGIASAVSSHPLAKAVLGGGIGAAVGSVIPGVGTVLGGAIGAGAALGKHYMNKMSDLIFGKKSKKHNGGLNYVPYNGYQASLHRGEMVLTRGEAQEYRKGRASGVNVTISGNTFNVRQESDIQIIAHELAKLIEREGALMA
jgi:hypothetical protein